MRILLITGKYPPLPCGIGDHTRSLARGLSRWRHCAFIFTSSIPTDFRSTEDPKVPVLFREATHWNFTDYRKILSILREESIELVHIQYHPASFRWHPLITLLPALLKGASRSFKPKVVVTLHELSGPRFPFTPGFLQRGWLFPLMLFSDAVIVTNKRDFLFLWRIPFLHSKLHLIPLAPTIDVSPLSPADRTTLRRRLGVKDPEVLLVRFGLIHNLRFSQIPTLLQAVQFLGRQGHSLKLLLAGASEGEGKRQVLSIARRLNVDGQVLFTDYRAADELSRYLQCADIAVQLYPEGICERRSALLAVMAHGLPVVCNQRGKIPLPFRHEENVFLIQHLDGRTLAQAVSTLIANPEFRNRLGENSKGALAHFSWERAARETHQLYGKLCRERQP